MANKALSLLSLLCVLLLSLLSQNTTVVAHTIHHHDKQSPYEFLNHLQGCHKGEKVKDVHKLKKYLETFGYLSHSRASYANNDEFDDVLETAVKTYQLNYHLNATGVLDSKTISMMTKTRCGIADIANDGSTSMRVGKKRHLLDSEHHFHAVSHYSFLPGEPKWSASKYHLTYGFKPQTRLDAITPVTRAFTTWAANSHFEFSYVEDYSKADLKISFGSGDHGDGFPFDGPGGTIAHAFAPQDGRFHYDGDEQWGVGAVQGAFDLETLALHEIGHLLGLGHSSVEGAIMWPTFSTGMTKGLHGDDIQGIKALYNQV